ncbi:MAG: FecCD family ABC transporter permease [Candidatus Aminicenantales bacterium]
MNGRKKTSLFFLFLLLAIIFSMTLSLTIGPVATTPRDLAHFLFRGDATFRTIFLDLRLCRALLAFLVGASLSLSGAILQGYFQNPMADPFVVGVSSAASFGAVLCLFLGLEATVIGLPVQSLLAFGSGLAIVCLVYALSRRKPVFKVETLLLTGIAAGALASSLTSFLLFMRSDAFEQAVFWLLGSFALADWGQVRLVLPSFMIILFVAQWFAKDMNLLTLGDDVARSLGCPVARVRQTFLALATLLAAIAVSVSGIIGFVGLIVPHGVRLLAGPDHRRLFLFSSLSGGVFLVLCDLAARTILSPAELPIGILTAFLGAPFFIFLLNRRR